MMKKRRILLWVIVGGVATFGIGLGLSFLIRIYSYTYIYDYGTHELDVKSGKIFERPGLHFSRDYESPIVSSLAMHATWPARYLESTWNCRECKNCGYDIPALYSQIQEFANKFNIDSNDVITMSWFTNDGGDMTRYLTLINGEIIEMGDLSGP